MKVLLVNSPMLHARELARAWTSIHLHVLFSHLRRQGVEVDLYDPVLEMGLPGGETAPYLERARAALAERSFDVAGVSCWTSFQYLGAMELGRLLRQHSPNAPIAVGGWHPTEVPADFTAADSPFDFVVRGPGEQVLHELVRAPRRPARPEVLRGTPARLDEIRYDWSYPHNPHGALVLSRGCPFRCLFCHEERTPVDCYSLDRAVEEYLGAAARSRDGFVHVKDAFFGLDRSWRRAFLKEIADRRLQVRPEVELRIDQVDSEDLALLGRAGAEVFFGVESGSPAVLGFMRKTPTPERYLARCPEVTAECDRRGVDYRLSFMFNHPGETRQMLEESIGFFTRFVFDRPDSRLVALASHRFAYLPGTPLDSVLSTFEERYGTRIGHPGWWRQPGDHQLLAEDNQASRDLSLEEATRLAQSIQGANWLNTARRLVGSARNAPPE